MTEAAVAPSSCGSDGALRARDSGCKCKCGWEVANSVGFAYLARKSELSCRRQANAEESPAFKLAA